MCVDDLMVSIANFPSVLK